MKKKDVKALKKEVKRRDEKRHAMIMGLMKNFAAISRKFCKEHGPCPATYEALMDAHLVMAGISFRYLVRNTLETGFEEAIKSYPKLQQIAFREVFGATISGATKVATGSSTEPLEHEAPVMVEKSKRVPPSRPRV